MNEIYIPSLEMAQQVADQYGTPTYITNADTLRDRVMRMRTALAWPKLGIFYAIKSNFNPAVVKVLRDEGVGIDAVSPFEVEYALRLGFPEEKIIFTGNNSSDEEIRMVSEKDVLLNIGSLSELERYGKMFSGKSVSIRLTPDVGAGESEKVETGWDFTKFGVLISDFPKAEGIIKKYNLKLVGVHCHIGSGFYNPEDFSEAAKQILDVAIHFPHLDFVDFGGGFGVRYFPNQKGLDLDIAYELVKPHLEAFSEKNGKIIEVRVEPGKYLVTESTCLLVQVTTVKPHGDHIFIGVNSGFNHLIRPAMYGNYHHALNITNPDDEIITVSLVGNVCETCDVFNKKLKISNPREGDLLAIISAGAYGQVQSSLYNMRPYAVEVMVDGGAIELVRKRQGLEEMLEGAGFGSVF